MEEREREREREREQESGHVNAPLMIYAQITNKAFGERTLAEWARRRLGERWCGGERAITQERGLHYITVGLSPQCCRAWGT